MLANKIRFSSSKRLIDKTQTPLTEIVKSTPAYTTSASARPQVLSNGWIVSVENDMFGQIRLQVSKNNGVSFQYLCYSRYSGAISTTFSISSYGTIVYFLIADANGYSYICKFDATTVTNIDLWASKIYVDLSQQTAMGGCSIAVNPTNGHLTAAWSSKNSTYPNSFNIRSAKSTDGGVTWVMTQITSYGAVGYDAISPTVVYMQNGYPIITFVYKIPSLYFIMTQSFSGSSWLEVGIYNVSASYTQASPSATVQRYGANVGRIWVAWHGSDSSSSAYNIRVSYSDDNGATWSAMTKLTTQTSVNDQLPSITTNNKGEVFIYYVGTHATYYDIFRLVRNTVGTWGSPEAVTNSTTATILFPSTCDNYYDFEQPIAIWQDNQDFGDKVMLHMNGVNNSTTFIDDSGKVWTANGNAKIVTTESKFGGACAYFDGSGDYISTPITSDFYILSGDTLTIDFWVKKDMNGNFEALFSGETYGLCAQIGDDNVFIAYDPGGSGILCRATIDDLLWHHIAIIRQSGTWYTYKDGTLTYTIAYSSPINKPLNTYAIGGHPTNSNYFHGHIDEFRWTKGIARWTSNFTPPTAEGVYYNNPPSCDFYGKYFV